jgi:hypothetical protein
MHWVANFGMNIKSVIGFIVCLLLFSTQLKAYELTDTIRLAPVVKKKKPYPLQPLIIKTSPTAFLWGGAFPFTSEYRFMMEITSSRKQSEQLSISILGKGVLYTAVEKSQKQSARFALKVSGWRIQYAHKFYLVNHRHAAPYGFYVAPLFSYANTRVAMGLNQNVKQEYYSLRHFNANAIIGIQVGKLHRLTLDIDAGIGYKRNVVYYHANSYSPATYYDTKDFGKYYNSNLNLVFDINLGYSF